MLDIILSGCNGRMGHALEAQCSTDTELNIVAGFDILGTSERNFPIFAVPSEFSGSADVVVDFSHPAALSSLLSFCLQRRLPIVLATTGYSQAQLAEIEDASQSIPIFRSGNFSLGVNVLLELLPELVQMLGPDYDLEMVELHHNRKKDSPSGTALRLAESLASARDWDLKDVACYHREGIIGERPKKEIGVQAIRGGDVVGVHTVYFMGPGERVEVTHHAHSRENFAQGALRAASWLPGQPGGKVYAVGDILKSRLK